jgi:4-phospho-D-threonate 3-dehydrogenase / 4-phospho-D-erythronate 3-dehydrogenase
MPSIGISLGDPAGIGPEVALRAASELKDGPAEEIALIGSYRLLERVSRKLQLPLPPALSAEQWLTAPRPQPPGCSVVDVPDLDAEGVVPGRWTAETGLASYRWVELAIQACLAGRIDAMVTGPIQKEAWRAAGSPYAGHTELLAEQTGSQRVRMLLTSPEISCLLVTIHNPLADVASLLTEEAIFESIVLAADAVGRRTERQQNRPPRISVLGLNPHAGEHGLMSHLEEERLIQPAIDRARELGLSITGPLPPDTAFIPAWRERTDVYVCMYHDQGLIPLKALAFDEGVNVTLGLPIVRTSVDHGTAMDLAWQGVADHRSLMAAVQMAAQLC